ncbi:MAG TPA: hypothetical protein VGW58_04940 [Pyrinomonadaceae bacterium]|nr:hypothetical protein [Pyrinomonadaceae bacterium]
MKLWLAAAILFPLLATTAAAQSAPSALASLPDADVLIYVSPQKILNEAAPKVMQAKDLAEMRNAFADIKKGAGIDPSTVEYLVLAVRFHKPAGDLSFVAPDVLAVAGGDFSADSLFSLAQLSLQEKLRVEKYGSKSIALMKIDPIVAQAEKNPMLKSLTEIGIVTLSGNSIAIGNLPYLKSAVDAAEGTGRINPATLESLMRDPNVLMAATGTPIASFAKAFGFFGTETTPREGRCNTDFGNFYTAITMSGNNFSLRGAMNADNPDTAKIIGGLFSALMREVLSEISEKQVQAVMQNIKLTPKDSEIVWEADVPQTVVAEIFKPSKPATPAATVTTPVKTTTKRRVPRKRR